MMAAAASPTTRTSCILRTKYTSTSTTPNLAFLSQQPSTTKSLPFGLRGGDSSSAAAADIEFESSDEEEEEEDDEEEDTPLAKSAKAATAKVQAATAKAGKAALNQSLKSALQEKKKSKKKASSTSLLPIPYIIKAILNPVTCIQMIKEYWSSMFNPNYLKDNVDVTEELRNAKDRSSNSSGGRGKKGKRKFKPGKSMSLSDLPPLPT